MRASGVLGCASWGMTLHGRAEPAVSASVLYQTPSPAKQHPFEMESKWDALDPNAAARRRGVMRSANGILYSLNWQWVVALLLVSAWLLRWFQLYLQQWRAAALKRFVLPLLAFTDLADLELAVTRVAGTGSQMMTTAHSTSLPKQQLLFAGSNKSLFARPKRKLLPSALSSSLPARPHSTATRHSSHSSHIPRLRLAPVFPTTTTAPAR